MLTAEVVPRHENRLHGRVVPQALAVAVGEPVNRRILIRYVRLNRSICEVLILSSSRVAEDRQLLGAFILAGL